MTYRKLFPEICRDRGTPTYITNFARQAHPRYTFNFSNEVNVNLIIPQIYRHIKTVFSLRTTPLANTLYMPFVNIYACFTFVIVGCHLKKNCTNFNY